MNPELFRKSSSGRVLRVGSGEAAYWAFVPDPLPPHLALPLDLVSALSEADRALGELAGLGRTLANPHLLIGPFIRREAVLSSRIEGTQADVTDLYAYEAGQLALPGLKPRPEADVRDVFNYARALEYGLQRIEQLPVSLRLLRELHGRLMEGVRGEESFPGEFRRTQNWIGPPGCTLLQADFVPPPVEAMLPALDSFEEYLHAADALPPLIRLALIHYQFEAIHPFVDGNGRIGRLLLSLLLVHWRLLTLPLLYLSAFFEARRDAYYGLLLRVSQAGDWAGWIQFFLKGVAEEAGDAIARTQALQDLHLEWRERLQARPRSSASALRLLDELFISPILTVPRAQKVLEVTHRAASLIVGRLVDEGILTLSPDSPLRNRRFWSEPILKIIGS
ncbi:MAG TPA: Fic/DOC family N-terminal domain-containing protein [Anaerolineales bacterium]|nr:Fic/DOC family N-terminal domain-containing protein [Anaerolineales bacterium]